MKKLLLLSLSLFLSVQLGQAQNQEKTSEQSHFKIGGYIQAEANIGQKDSHLNVGKVLSSDKRSIGLRRGRVKMTYQHSLSEAVFQLNITEASLSVINAYFKLKSPWEALGQSSLTTGVFLTPFGHEICYGSAKRESVERSRIVRSLFAGLGNVGALLTLQADKKSLWSMLQFQGGILAGNAIGVENNGRQDFISRLTIGKQISKNFYAKLGSSAYLGYLSNKKGYVYSFENEGFKQIKQEGEYELKKYFGIETELRLNSMLGQTKVLGEYLFGEQPALASSSVSPRNFKGNQDLFIRNFKGAYLQLSQSMGKLPLTAVFKYEWYDPNTQVAKDEIGKKVLTGVADLTYQTFGFGLLSDITKHIRLHAYYEINKNEVSSHLQGFKEDIKDNLFYLRLQYVF